MTKRCVFTVKWDADRLRWVARDDEGNMLGLHYSQASALGIAYGEAVRTRAAVEIAIKLFPAKGRVRIDRVVKGMKQ